MSTRVVRLEPTAAVRCGSYDLDAFAIGTDDAGELHIWLELGAGLGIFQALPVGPGERLRLFHTDGAAYTVDEPELVDDRFVFDLPRQCWRGSLGTVGQDLELIEVIFEATAAPASYRCELTLRDARGATTTRTFAWAQPG